MSIRPADAIIEDYLSLVDDSMVAVLPHALRIMVELGVADVLDTDRATPVKVVATAVDADPDALARLLRALASVGFLIEECEDCFCLTPLGTRLRHDVENGLHASLANAESQLAWLRATDTLRNGLPAFNLRLGQDFFGAKEADRGANLAFLGRMRERTGRLYRQVSQAVDWRPSQVILDIGGADGFLLGEILGVAQHAKGILFDRRQVIDELESGGGRLGPAVERCRMVAGDFFEAVPDGADTHLLCSVIHDWPDDQARLILASSLAALAPGGHLLIVEMLVPPGTAHHPSRWSDLGMMVLTGGRERTLAEFDRLLDSAGYSLRGVSPIPGSSFSVIEATASSAPEASTTSLTKTD